MSQPGAPGSVDDAEPTIGRLVSDISSDLSTLVRGEIALAKSELRVSAKAGGVGAGLLVAVGVLLLFVITMLSMAGGFFFAWLFDRDIPLGFTWGFLVMTGVWLLVVLIFALVGIRFLKKVKAPKRTIATVQEIPSALKGKTDPRITIDLPAATPSPAGADAAAAAAERSRSGKRAR
ncbi:phage holin family protein [Mumia sp. zg.B17]|uniref:phage holin family protein n=1 Tax=unclassified Mumia TaxID=2621872 RepID=UPI001C6F2271|nr:MULTISPECIES: phage holin family protein [unclassified Mumia]MBW9207425.1 phage holin family protein [Mumia sp. zg.B17]MBW9210234.1 phage holin family protein [Mumia sp. zg.B21]MDD9350474.1 phage holin family protein [Mumia sp.]